MSSVPSTTLYIPDDKKIKHDDKQDSTDASERSKSHESEDSIFDKKTPDDKEKEDVKKKKKEKSPVRDLATLSDRGTCNSDGEFDSRRPVSRSYNTRARASSKKRQEQFESAEREKVAQLIAKVFNNLISLVSRPHLV